MKYALFAEGPACETKKQFKTVAKFAKYNRCAKNIGHCH